MWKPKNLNWNLKMNINNEERNIQFFRDRKGVPYKIKYNALKKFQGNIIRVPSYIVDEVYRHKMAIELYHNNEYLTTYFYDNLNSFISHIEEKIYEGYYSEEPIEYKLAYVEV